MKTNFSRGAKEGLTVIEMLVVIACVVIVIAMLLPYGTGSHKAPFVACMNNVRQIDLGFLMYASDNDGKFAIQTPVTNGGTKEFLDRNQTFPHYQKLSKYILSMPVLVCPADKKRKPATSLAALADTNISYCLNADVSTNNPIHSIMTSDHYLQVNNHPVPHGTLVLNTNMDVAWAPQFHRGGGVLGFVDGHAEFSRNGNLNLAIQRQGLATTRFSVP